MQKSCYIHGYDLLQRKFQDPNQQRKDAWVKHRRNNKKEKEKKLKASLGALFQWCFVRTCLIVPATVCDNSCEVLPNRRPHPNPGVLAFYWGSVTGKQHPHEWPELINSTSTLRAKTSIHHMSHCEEKLIGQVTWPMPHASKNTLRQSILRDQRLFPRNQPSLVLKISFLWNVQDLSNKGLLS